MFKSLVLFALFVIAFSVLEVDGPQCLLPKFKEEIRYTLSNFGQIPYGQTLIGQLIIPENPLLCSIENETLIKKKDSSSKAIILVERGTCKFTRKVINAQNLGADLIIIYDNNPGDTPQIFMKNDGHGHLAEIPSLFISNTDGQKLQDKSDKCADLPIIKVTFEMDQRDVSDVILWLDAGNRQTYILARDFYKQSYYEIIEDRINFDVRFKVENKCHNWVCSKEDCIGVEAEKYCRNVQEPENPGIDPIKGRDLILEQARQYFLWQEVKNTNKKTKWWKYMTKFDSEDCIERMDVEDCSYTVMDNIFTKETIAKVKKNVQEAINNIGIRGKDNIFQQSWLESRQYGVVFFPEVTINDRVIYGLFKAPEVFETICHSLIDMPKECVNFIKENHTDGTDQSRFWSTIFIILLVMTVGFIIALLVYTKIIKREVNQQLSVEVNRMVEKYVSLGKKDSASNTSTSYNKMDD